MIKLHQPRRSGRNGSNCTADSDLILFIYQLVQLNHNDAPLGIDICCACASSLA
jgi:hypothetical protein